jgi:hypothetical protein
MKNMTMSTTHLENTKQHKLHWQQNSEHRGDRSHLVTIKKWPHCNNTYHSATQFQTLQQIKTLAFSITIPLHAAPMDTLHICHTYNHSVSSTFEIVHILQTLKPLERPDKYTLQILCC